MLTSLHTNITLVFLKILLFDRYLFFLLFPVHNPNPNDFPKSDIPQGSLLGPLIFLLLLFDYIVYFLVQFFVNTVLTLIYADDAQLHASTNDCTKLYALCVYCISG